MRNFKRVIVIMMFFCLAFSWNILALSQEPIKTVEWKKLAGFMVELSGWNKKGEVEGIQTPVPAKSDVWQTYDSKTGKKSLDINIMDSGKSMILLMPIKMMMMNGKTAQGFTEKITIEGFPGAKMYDNTKKEANLIVLILDRFVLQMFGHNFTEAEVSELEDTAKEFDLEGIAKLGK